MKHIKYYFLALAGMVMMNACNDDEALPGNPVMTFKTEPATALFGDSLPFTINAADIDVPLSTLKAQLYFGEEKVSETVIRTKVSGEDYTGKIYVPFLANVPNGRATLKFILQNIHFTLTEKEMEVALSRPNFPYLILVAGDKEYKMTQAAGAYEYSVTDDFEQKVKAYIKAPKVGENGNEITFGWESGAITQGTTSLVTFSNVQAGKYAITFNTLTYQASPFVKLFVNNNEMEVVDDDNYKIDLKLKQGEDVTVTGIPGFEDWWIDSDFFEAKENGVLKFLPIDGNYRITANFAHKYLIVESMDGTSTATLQKDGTGAIWIIGTGIGKPSVAANEVGWDTNKALCLTQISAKKYQISVTVGKQVSADNINFKFFHQKGWGGEFKNDVISTSGDIVFIGDGTNGRDPGNLGITEGKALENGATYRFIVDVTKDIESAVLTVEKIK